MSETGTRGKQEIRGVGKAEVFDSVTLPQLALKLGGASVMLAPENVVLKPIGNRHCVGNFGMDLFKQSRYLAIDLRAMRLQLTPP